MKSKRHANMKIGFGPLIVSGFFGFLLLATTSQQTSVSAQTGTVVGKVSREKQKPEDPDSPLQGAQVFIENGQDEKGKPKLEQVGKSTPNGVYRFEYAPGFKKVVIHKEPFWGPPKNREVEVIRGRKTPSVTTYLERESERVTMALDARQFLLAGDSARTISLLATLVSVCNSIENEECDLVRVAKKAVERGDTTFANAQLEALASLLNGVIPVPTVTPFPFHAEQSMY